MKLDQPFRAATRRGGPPPRRHVGLQRKPPGRRDLRRQRPRLAAHRRRAQPQRAGVAAGAAPGSGRLPGSPCRAYAVERSGDHQAVPRPRRPEPPGADGRHRRAGCRRGPGRVLPTGRHPRSGQRTRPRLPLEPGRGLPRDRPDDDLAVTSRSRAPPPWRTSRRSSPPPASTGSSSGPSDLAASMGLLGQQDHPEVVEAVLSCIGVANASGVQCRRQRLRSSARPPLPGSGR